MNPPAPGVGRYQIVEKLGEGATATVYKACASGERPLAIKFLHAEWCRDADYRSQFLREAKAAGALSHPGIVKVFDSGEVEGRPYICMELVEGQPLSAVLVEGEALPLQRALDIGIQIAHALDHAHSRGIVHRDVKPANVMCLAGEGTVKLADFGIACMPSTAPCAAQPERVMGTPHYMSPEHVAGGMTDARADLWALGVILYQMVAGRRPFEASTRPALVQGIVHDDPAPIAKMRGEAPLSLCQIISRCLNKQPDERFQSGMELAGALTRTLHEI